MFNKAIDVIHSYVFDQHRVNLNIMMKPTNIQEKIVWEWVSDGIFDLIDE